MIETLEIHNFKSIKDLTLPCKRFNIFIGEPNTGKSNILEALGLVSFVGAWQYQPDAELDGFVRHERLSHLFHDEEVEKSLSIKWARLGLFIDYHNGIYEGRCEDLVPDYPNEKPARLADFVGDGNGIGSVTKYSTRLDRFPERYVFPSQVRFYRSPAIEHFRPSACEHLLPPHGSNLLALLATNRQLGQMVSLPFASQGLKLWLRPHENKVDVARNFDDMVITSFPYSLVSETLQRSTFYTAAMETNKDSVLVLEEPETHTFPNETKLLAEQIALDENNNQYFIVTHNPYFLMPLLSKAPKDEIAINIVYQVEGEYQTKVRPLVAEELPELFELNIFANLDRYLEDD